MKDKTILITGATSGIGKATAIALAQMGSRIIFNSRNEQKGIHAAQEIQKLVPGAKVDFFPCDLSSLEAVDRFASKVQQEVDQIDVLINNAGVMPTSRQYSQDGIELNWAVNYLAGRLLTDRLIDKLKAAEEGRIIFVSSIVHKQGRIDLQDLNKQHQPFNALRFYASSKLAQVVLARDLADQYASSGISVFSLHPGVIGTQIGRDLPRPLPWIFKTFFKGPDKGARTSVFLASSPQLSSQSGQHFINKKQAAYHPIADDLSFRKGLAEATHAQIQTIIPSHN